MSWCSWSLCREIQGNTHAHTQSIINTTSVCQQKSTTTVQRKVLDCGGTSSLFRMWGCWGRLSPDLSSKSLGLGASLGWEPMAPRAWGIPELLKSLHSVGGLGKIMAGGASPLPRVKYTSQRIHTPAVYGQACSASSTEQLS